MNSIEEESYQRQKEQEEKMAIHPPSIISAPESIDCLRHQRMFDTLATKLVRVFPSASWMTIGDGRFGADTVFLKRAGAKSIHTTSLTDSSLKEAKEKGWIDSFSAENAESLTFPDNSFDFVICKESYHHFPRPPIALYEMLRVARIGIVLIEPYRARFSPLGFLKPLFKQLTGRTVFSDYEPSGNYIYRLSIEELYHMARAMDLPSMAWAFDNGVYHPKLFKAKQRTRLETTLFKLIVGFQNLLSFFRLLSPGGVSCVLFKQEINERLIGCLKHERLKVQKLGRNPYLG